MQLTRKGVIDKKQSRDSNIELLRIIAMVLIILSHIVIHCIGVQLTDSSSIIRLDNGLFNNPVFYKKLLILVSFTPVGIVGNVIFIIISGYFMVNKEINIEKTAKKLFIQLGYSVTVLIIVSMVFQIVCNSKIYLKLVNIHSFNTSFWFAGYYFSILLIGKLGLNKYLQGIDKKTYGLYLITLFAITQFGWIGTLLESVATGLRTLLSGIFIYSLGGYIKKYDSFRFIKGKVLVLIIIFSYILIYISYYNITLNNINLYMTSNQSGEFVQSLMDFQNYQIMPIIIGISLFELFKRVELKNNQIINYIAGSTFMVYVLHDNSFCYSIWGLRDWISLLYYNPVYFVCWLFFYTLITFLICLFIYFLYNLLTKTIKIWYIY
ncbi:hypothetical protein B5F14_09770 [Faecalitalea cylindroides]|uniref:Acyltransferase 3 domain-containing protein n=1 Tax=Faecalitalea cylindroides TaxID=39483 RepID=A0A1Y4LN48_9FIRM|nr:acyltransferase family protein [Faecalitalea cylindroides]OUP56311.1 hypothetical protein B5F14_09770 [Faecalitalea cylindroides]